MFRSLKNNAAKIAVNQFIKGIASVRELDIDKSTQIVVAQVDLAGEALPVRIEAAGYQLGPDHVTIAHFVCDRLWIETALNQYLAGKKIAIPEKVCRAIQWLA
jgi:hypothetical protein